MKECEYEIFCFNDNKYNLERYFIKFTFSGHFSMQFEIDELAYKTIEDEQNKNILKLENVK